VVDDPAQLRAATDAMSGNADPEEQVVQFETKRAKRKREEPHNADGDMPHDATVITLQAGRLHEIASEAEAALIAARAVPYPRQSLVPSLRRALRDAHRQRRRDGLRCIVVQLRETEIDQLIRRKLLQADARHDVHGIRNAFDQRPE
jgi:hypothetical protein